MQYYEDVVVGEVARFGSYVVTHDEAVEFATKYDPQPFHLSDEAAAKTHFKRLAVSGWHTGAMMMRMLVDHMAQNRRASLGSPGIDKLRWIKPVHPGDTLSCETESISKRRSASRPEMGLVDGVVRVFNQHGDLVMTMENVGLIAVRDPDAAIEDA